MTANDEDVFRNVATAGQKLLLQFQALAAAGSGSVLTPFTENGGALSRRTAAADKGADMMRAILQEQRDEQLRMLNESLADLDRRSEEQLRATQERLAEILRTANKTKDGRAVFQDEDGTIYDQYGNEVATDDIDWEKWEPDGWKWSDFQGATEAVTKATEIRNEVLAVKQDLSEGNLTDDEFDALVDRAADLEERITGVAASGQHLADPVERSTSAAKEYDQGTTLGDWNSLSDLFSGVTTSEPAPIAAEMDNKLGVDPVFAPR